MNARATRFPLFDSLRALAALSIFGTHAYFVLQANQAGPLREFAVRLDVGVFIFFAISGFLLYRPFVRARLRGEAAPATRVYAWRRLLRIGPAYWIALTVVAIWLQLGDVARPENAPWLYLFGQSYRPETAIAGLPQAWSLCVEAAFYLFLPMYALAMRSLPAVTERGRLRIELVALAVLAGAGFGFTALSVSTGAVAARSPVFPLHLTLPSYLEVFAVGMCLAVLSVWYEERDPPAWLRPLDRFPGIAWAAALVAFWAVSTRLGLDGHAGETIGTWQYVGRTALYCVIALGVVVPAVFGTQTRGLVRRVLANRVLLWIGLVSYSLFLYHVVVVIQVDRWNLPVGTAVALALSLAIAAASYYVIERPALSLKQLVRGRPEPPPREALAEPAPIAPAHVTHAG
jgi:peptidoglycan/LPS O-acetylase OafA/YrhL